MNVKDRYEVVIRRVAYVLKHHDRELQAVEKQIAYERETLEEDLKRIRARALPGAVDYGKDPVQGGSPDPDGKMVAVMDALDHRKEAADRVFKKLTQQREEIEGIRLTILDMEDPNKDVLLALYYPYRTYEQAAAELGIDRSTVARRREIAFKKLTEIVFKNLKKISEK